MKEFKDSFKLKYDLLKKRGKIKSRYIHSISEFGQICYDTIEKKFL